MSNKTLRETQEGLAVTLNPVDSRTTLQRIKSQLSSLPSSGLAYSRCPIQELQSIPEEMLPQPTEDELEEQVLEDNPIWRDRRSMNQVSMDEIEAVRQDSGPMLLKHI